MILQKKKKKKKKLIKSVHLDIVLHNTKMLGMAQSMKYNHRTMLAWKQHIHPFYIPLKYQIEQTTYYVMLSYPAKFRKCGEAANPPLHTPE